MSRLGFSVPVLDGDRRGRPRPSRVGGRWALATAVALLALAAGSPGAQPQGVRLRASLTPEIVRPGERATAVVTVEGVQRSQSPTLKAPPGVTVRPLTRREIAGGAGSEFSFGVVAAAAGTYPIGPAELRVGGSVHRSDPLTLRVAREGAAGAAAQAQGRQVFLRASADNATPFVGEQVLYTVRIYRSVNIFKTSYSPPSFEGFVVPAPAVEAEYSTLEGDQNLVVKEHRYAIYPSRSGSARIGEARFACKIKVGTKAGSKSLFEDDYTGRSEDSVAVAPAIDVHVKPIPPGPPDFTGLVGATEISARIEPAEIPWGGTATLTIQVDSTGNVLEIPPPAVPSPAGLRAIADSPKVEWLARDSAPFLGRKILKTALVASEPGAFEIPGALLTYFDPAAETYRAARAGLQRLTVLPRGEVARVPGGGADSQVTAVEEIRGLKTSPTTLEPGAFGGTPGAAWLSLSILPAVACLIAFGYGRHLDRLRTDPAYARGRVALARARSKLDEARRMASAAKADVFYGLLGRTLRQYVGDRLDLSGAALTPQEIEAKIHEIGIMDGVEVELKEFLVACEYRQLARGEGREGERDEFVARARAILEKLEKDLPR